MITAKRSEVAAVATDIPSVESQPEWEEVQCISGRITERLPIEGGWLYLVTSVTPTFSRQLVFVPGPPRLKHDDESNAG